MSRGYVWVVDDDSSIRWVMEKTLSSAHIKCETFADAESVLLALERETPTFSSQTFACQGWMALLCSIKCTNAPLNFR